MLNKFIFLLLVSPIVLFARIGENQKVIEKRLDKSHAGDAYDESAQENLKSRVSYKKIFPHLEKMNQDYEIVVYWKSDDGEAPSKLKLPKPMKIGWDYHVVYLKGVSVLEYYKKNGGVKINDFELSGLFLINAKSELKPYKPTFTEENPQKKEDKSYIGYNYKNESGSIRAMFNPRSKIDLMIFNNKLDQRLLLLNDSIQSEQKIENKKNLRNSLEGF